MDKWNSLLNAQMLTDMELNSVGTQSSEVFPSVLPMVRRVAAQTVGLDLVSVLPMNSNTDEELTIIKAEVEAENRNRKIDSLIEGGEYEEMKITEHPDFNTGPRGELLYLDYSYTDTNTKKADF
jgi:hypothetical protein